MSENSPKRSIAELNPLMIQSYFDNELTSDEFAAISHDDLMRSPTYQALAELRQAVRLESQLALDDIDGYALLDAINARLDVEVPPSVSKPAMPVELSFAPKRRTTAQVFRRWAPALVGAALFILSIPGLVTMFTNHSMPEPQTPTVVVIDSNRNAPTAQAVVQNPQDSQHVWNAANQNDPLTIHPNPNPSKSQLTIEEMDYALRHLINRIETLENAHINGLETGKKALFPTPLIPQTAENEANNDNL